MKTRTKAEAANGSTKAAAAKGPRKPEASKAGKAEPTGASTKFVATNAETKAKVTIILRNIDGVKALRKTEATTNPNESCNNESSNES